MINKPWKFHENRLDSFLKMNYWKKPFFQKISVMDDHDHDDDDHDDDDNMVNPFSQKP